MTRRFTVGGAGLLLLALLLPCPIRAQAEGPTEYQIKAAFLFNFAQFVQWPPDAFAATDDSLTIGVVGTDPFGPYLDAIIRGEQVGDHHLAVRRFASVEQAVACQILFVGTLDKRELARLFERLKDHPVLTVGDAEGFARQGGMIRFVTENNRIRLRINLAAAEATNLKLSSKLLRPAEIVGTGQD